MEFCNKCDNMLYMKILEENDEEDGDSNSKDKKLIYFCKCCGIEVKDLTNINNFRVFKFNNEVKFKDTHINEYTKYDPTLPHMNNIKCPNLNCKSNIDPESHNQDVIYLRYDDKNMKYMYLCCHCDFTWVP